MIYQVSSNGFYAVWHSAINQKLLATYNIQYICIRGNVYGSMYGETNYNIVNIETLYKTKSMELTWRTCVLKEGKAGTLYANLWITWPIT